LANGQVGDLLNFNSKFLFKLLQHSANVTARLTSVLQIGKHTIFEKKLDAHLPQTYGSATSNNGYVSFVECWFS